VLDISSTALKKTQERLGTLADKVHWIEADVTQVMLPPNAYDIWHDRAVFHFLTDAEDRRRYVERVRHALKPEGHIILATFSLDGPTQCSGLDVIRYDAGSLRNEFGTAFELVESVREAHQTPFGTQQAFIYCYCRKR
jgi:ubiquinone/menaquinone biosynthesis C-methylase UbiE